MNGMFDAQMISELIDQGSKATEKQLAYLQR
jgi:hypothetical protein